MPPLATAETSRAIERLDGVEWAEVDAVVGRLIVVFDPEAIDADDLIESLETVEELHDVAAERFPHDRADHPADRMPIHLNVFGIAADVAGLGYATAAQALHFMRLPAEIPGLVSVADNAPRVRRFLEGRLGPPTADVVLTTTNAAAQALASIAQQPDASGTISRTLFVSLAMIESTAIYCFVVAMILIFANPFWCWAIEATAAAAGAGG